MRLSQWQLRAGLGNAVWDDPGSDCTNASEGVFAMRAGGISTASGGSSTADSGSVSARDLDAASGASDWRDNGGSRQCPDCLEDHPESGPDGEGLSPGAVAG